MRTSRFRTERATRPLGNTMVNNANSAFLSDWACADLRWPSAWPQSQLRISGETALSAPPTAGRIGCARGNRECAVPTTLIENYVHRTQGCTHRGELWAVEQHPPENLSLAKANYARTVPHFYIVSLPAHTLLVLDSGIVIHDGTLTGKIIRGFKHRIRGVV